MKCEDTQFGFRWGPAEITRVCSDPKNQWVIINLSTEKYKDNKAIQLYVTKSGKVRIFSNGEWKRPERITKSKQV